MGRQLGEQTMIIPPPVPVTVGKPRRKLGRGWRILRVVVIIVVVLGAAAGIGYAVFSPQIGALLVARGFCQQVEQQHYAAAYQDFAPDLQQRVPRAAFLAISSRADTLEGPVIGCSVAGIDVSSDRQSVVVHSVISRSLQGQSHEDLALSYESGQWVIAEPPDPLLLPLTTAYFFCQDLEQQQYSTAYGLLSVQTQAKVGNSLLFEGIFTASHVVTGNLKDCQVASATLGANGQQLSIASTLVFQHFPSLSAQLVEVEESPGEWAVDKLALSVLSFSIDVPPGS